MENYICGYRRRHHKNIKYPYFLSLIYYGLNPANHERSYSRNVHVIIEIYYRPSFSLKICIKNSTILKNLDTRSQRIIFFLFVSNLRHYTSIFRFWFRTLGQAQEIFKRMAGRSRERLSLFRIHDFNELFFFYSSTISDIIRYTRRVLDNGAREIGREGKAREDSGAIGVYRYDDACRHVMHWELSPHTPQPPP